MGGQRVRVGEMEVDDVLVTAQPLVTGVGSGDGLRSSVVAG